MHALLDRPHLTVSAREPDSELARIHAVVEHKVLVDGRGELEEMFCALLAARTAPPMPKTLDLVGHATPASLLDLSGWVIDRANPTVTAFFRELADNEVLPRLGIASVRLFGCGTASTQRGRDTLATLTEILEIPVLGTTSIVHAGHFRRDGFDPVWNFLLVGPQDLAAPAVAPVVVADTLDIDRLSAVPLDPNEPAWPRHIVGQDDAKRLLALVRRSEGAEMPGLLARPVCEIALPTGRGNLHHMMQIMLEGQFVRVYSNATSAGLMYPVRDPSKLLALVESLPRA